MLPASRSPRLLWHPMNRLGEMLCPTSLGRHLVFLKSFHPVDNAHSSPGATCQGKCLGCFKNSHSITVGTWADRNLYFLLF